MRRGGVWRRERRREMTLAAAHGVSACQRQVVGLELITKGRETIGWDRTRMTRMKDSTKGAD